MQKSDSITELAKALVKAQAQLPAAEKGAVNPAFKSRYANLADCWEACRKPLIENGLSVSQLPAPGDDGRLHLTTLLLHISGEWICSECVLPLAKNDPQGYGSAMTYARRYGLAAIIGLVQDDDDGNAASHPAATAPRSQQQAQQQAGASKPTQSPQGTLTWQGVLKAAESVPGLTEPNPDKPQYQKPSAELFHLCAKANVPKKFSEWQPEDCQRVLHSIQLYEANLAENPELPDISGVEDPFADQ